MPSSSPPAAPSPTNSSTNTCRAPKSALSARPSSTSPPGQLDFIARINGQAQDWTRARDWQGFDALERTAAAGNDGLIAAAEALVEDADVVVPYMQKRPVFPKSLFLTHAFAHGVLHRTEICVMMRTLAVDPPNLDGWEYAAAAGMGEEAS